MDSLQFNRCFWSSCSRPDPGAGICEDEGLAAGRPRPLQPRVVMGQQKGRRGTVDRGVQGWTLAPGRLGVRLALPVRVRSGVLGKPLGTSEPVSSIEIVPTQAVRVTAPAGKREWVSLREAVFACLVCGRHCWAW